MEGHREVKNKPGKLLTTLMTFWFEFQGYELETDLLLTFNVGSIVNFATYDSDMSVWYEILIFEWYDIIMVT